MEYMACNQGDAGLCCMIWGLDCKESPNIQQKPVLTVTLTLL